MPLYPIRYYPSVHHDESDLRANKSNIYAVKVKFSPKETVQLDSDSTSPVQTGTPKKS